MTNINIRIRIKKISDYSKSSGDTFKKKTLLLMIESFAYYILNLYGRLIEEEINSPRYKGKWEPIEEKGYIEYLGVTPHISILYLLQDSLEVRKIGSSFIVRVTPTYKYPGTKLYLLKVLRAIEQGTADFNARPILSKNARKIENRIIDLWRGYLAMRGIG